jgi:hypothetical protein
MIFSLGGLPWKKVLLPRRAFWFKFSLDVAFSKAEEGKTKAK